MRSGGRKKRSCTCLFSSISSSDVSPYQGAQSSPSNIQKIQKKFQQLGQDLQSGKLSQAQADFAASTSKPATSGNLATDFNKLSEDLQSGYLSAAQGDFATLQQDVQQQSSRSAAGHHHHHSQDSSSFQNSPVQLFSQLGQALQPVILLPCFASFLALPSLLRAASPPAHAAAIHVAAQRKNRKRHDYPIADLLDFASKKCKHFNLQADITHS